MVSPNPSAASLQKTMDKKLALFDWDGTLRRGFTIEAWIRFLVREKVLKKEAEDKISYLFSEYQEHEITHDALSQKSAEVYASALEGCYVEDIYLAASRFIEEDKSFLNSFSVSLLSFLQAQEIEIVVISGAPSEILNIYREKLSAYYRSKKLFAY